MLPEYSTCFESTKSVELSSAKMGQAVVLSSLVRKIKDVFTKQRKEFQFM